MQSVESRSGGSCGVPHGSTWTECRQSGTRRRDSEIVKGARERMKKQAKTSTRYQPQLEGGKTRHCWRNSKRKKKKKKKITEEEDEHLKRKGKKERKKGTQLLLAPEGNAARRTQQTGGTCGWTQA